MVLTKSFNSWIKVASYIIIIVDSLIMSCCSHIYRIHKECGEINDINLSNRCFEEVFKNTSGRNRPEDLKMLKQYRNSVIEAIVHNVKTPIDPDKFCSDFTSMIRKCRNEEARKGLRDSYRTALGRLSNYIADKECRINLIRNNTNTMNACKMALLHDCAVKLAFDFSNIKVVENTCNEEVISNLKDTLSILSKYIDDDDVYKSARERLSRIENFCGCPSRRRRLLAAVDATAPAKIILERTRFYKGCMEEYPVKLSELQKEQLSNILLRGLYEVEGLDLSEYLEIMKYMKVEMDSESFDRMQEKIEKNKSGMSDEAVGFIMNEEIQWEVLPESIKSKICEACLKDWNYKLDIDYANKLVRSLDIRCTRMFAKDIKLILGKEFKKKDYGSFIRLAKEIADLTAISKWKWYKNIRRKVENRIRLTKNIFKRNLKKCKNGELRSLALIEKAKDYNVLMEYKRSAINGCIDSLSSSWAVKVSKALDRSCRSGLSMANMFLRAVYGIDLRKLASRRKCDLMSGGIYECVKSYMSELPNTDFVDSIVEIDFCLEASKYVKEGKYDRFMKMTEEKNDYYSKRWLTSLRKKVRIDINKSVIGIRKNMEACRKGNVRGLRNLYRAKDYGMLKNMKDDSIGRCSKIIDEKVEDKVEEAMKKSCGNAKAVLLSQVRKTRGREVSSYLAQKMLKDKYSCDESVDNKNIVEKLGDLKIVADRIRSCICSKEHIKKSAEMLRSGDGLGSLRELIRADREYEVKSHKELAVKIYRAVAERQIEKILELKSEGFIGASLVQFGILLDVFGIDDESVKGVRKILADEFNDKIQIRKKVEMKTTRTQGMYGRDLKIRLYDKLSSGTNSNYNEDEVYHADIIIRGAYLGADKNESSSSERRVHRYSVEEKELNREKVEACRAIPSARSEANKEYNKLMAAKAACSKAADSAYNEAGGGWGGLAVGLLTKTGCDNLSEAALYDNARERLESLEIKCQTGQDYNYISVTKEYPYEVKTYKWEYSAEAVMDVLDSEGNILGKIEASSSTYRSDDAWSGNLRVGLHGDTLEQPDHNYIMNKLIEEVSQETSKKIDVLIEKKMRTIQALSVPKSPEDIAKLELAARLFAVRNDRVPQASDLGDYIVDIMPAEDARNIIDKLGIDMDEIDMTSKMEKLYRQLRSKKSQYDALEPFDGKTTKNDRVDESKEFVDDGNCLPPCRKNFVCIDGKCVSGCNPPCPKGTVCRNRDCHPK